MDLFWLGIKWLNLNKTTIWYTVGYLFTSVCIMYSDDRSVERFSILSCNELYTQNIFTKETEYNLKSKFWFEIKILPYDLSFIYEK